METFEERDETLEEQVWMDSENPVSTPSVGPPDDGDRVVDYTPFGEDAGRFGD